MKNVFLSLSILLLVSSCSVSKGRYDPNKKFSPQELQQDYELFRNILEESHPSLYWYTSKDSVDYYFQAGQNKLKDSLTENKFRSVLSYVLAQLHCGHTSVRGSKAAVRYAERARTPLFPLSIKAWKDTVVITSNISRRDSTVMRGALLKSIDGRPVSIILDSMFRHLSGDGYNFTHKFQTVSNVGVFRSMYASLYGLKSRTPIEYIDTAGVLRTAVISLGNLPDSARRSPVQQRPVQPQPSKKERKKMSLNATRNLRIDTALNTAFLEVNSFGTGSKLRSFFKRSFREIHQQHVPNLVVDMRGNGGGSVILSNLLTKYIATQPFKIADSLYAVKKKSHYGKYQDNYFLNRLFFIFFTRRHADGYYHFNHFEGRYFHPKKKYHFDGITYIVTGGNTFSAATLFTKALKDERNVVIVGEETGGGEYGNSAWLIPDVTLPRTKVRFRLPLFRLVIDKNAVKGRGVMPEVEADPTVNAIRKNADYKMEKVRKLIMEKSGH